MPRFAANLTTLFNELPFLDRFEAAAAAGFTAVEFQLPYAFDAADIAQRLERFRLVPVLHNLPAGDWDRGERGIACHPDRGAEFRTGVAQAITYAKALGCAQLNCLAGLMPAGVGRGALRRTFIENLRFAADALGKEGLRLLIEPINHHDMPGFFLTRSGQALEIIEEVGSPNLLLQYDIYHMQIMEGDIARTIEANLPRIGHIQIADNPGRNEPGTGELNWPFLFAHLDRIGYGGWVGCEYKPSTTTEAGLDWFRAVPGAAA